MIYSAYLDSNVISVCSVFSQSNYISLFIVLQKCQIFRTIPSFMICRALQCRENRKIDQDTLTPFTFRWMLDIEQFEIKHTSIRQLTLEYPEKITNMSQVADKIMVYRAHLAKSVIRMH
jgi:hypothetical protein